MKITIEKERPILSIEDWFEIAPPKGEKTQWKVGRSAMEMARFALSDAFPSFVSDLVTTIPVHDTEFSCEPEAKTTLRGMGKGGPRNHDLLMCGKESIIGVEAKVSESFDKKISEKRKGATQNQSLRLDSCIKFLFGESAPKEVEDMYYQLFSATIGTILQAVKDNKKHAIVLFLTFTGNVSKEIDYSAHVEENNSAYEKFCLALGLSKDGGKLKYIPGLGKNQIECWIKRANVVIDYNYTIK